LALLRQVPPILFLDWRLAEASVAKQGCSKSETGSDVMAGLDPAMQQVARNVYVAFQNVLAQRREERESREYILSADADPTWFCIIVLHQARMNRK
jgi:hypothetical protein